MEKIREKLIDLHWDITGIDQEHSTRQSDLVLIIDMIEQLRDDIKENENHSHIVS